jgi:hypothetical protein
MSIKPDLTLGINPVASHILAVLNAGWPSEMEGVFRVETSAWYNGRERGICLTVTPKERRDVLYITFGECRNSDQIFVDRWTSGALFNPPTVHDHPEERDLAYMNRFYFPQTALLSSVKSIMDTIIAHGRGEPLYLPLSRGEKNHGRKGKAGVR